MATARTIDAAISATLVSAEEVLRGEGESVARRAVGEERFADLAVDQLLELTADCVLERSRWAGYHGVSIARQLLDAFDANWSRWEPAQLLAVADAALFIAKSSDRRTPALLFRACKERANALRALNRFADAFRSLDEAEEYASDTHHHRLHAAVLAHNRAAVHCEMDDSAAALPLLFEAQDGFLACGETERWNQSRAFEGAVWLGVGRRDEACRLFHTILDNAMLSGDRELVAIQTGNIGLGFMEVRDNDAAKYHLKRAVEMCTSLGWNSYRAKLRVTLGVLAIRDSGVEAIAQVEDACAELERLGMAGDWAAGRLSMAEELAMADPTADVSELCRQARDSSLSVGMLSVAQRAERMLGAVAGRNSIHA